MKGMTEMQTTRIRFGFRSKSQVPLFMVWKEYYYTYPDPADMNKKVMDLTYAEVLFSLDVIIFWRGKNVLY
jgi:hypothetical protein